MTDFLIGRQQILDSQLNTVAFEILFRGNQFDLNDPHSATLATNQVISDSLLEIGLESFVGKHKAFINFTEQNILDDTPLALPKDRVVIEVLETVTPSVEVIAKLKQLSEQGYQIALDDFVLDDRWRPLLEIADIIKIDVLSHSLDQVKTLITALKPYKLTLLAEKVETHEQFETLKQWDFELFQGFFFSKPNLVEGKRLGVNQNAVIELLAVVNDANARFEAIGLVIGRDVTLSYKLLQYINSSYFSLPTRIDSIKQAIAFIGLNELKRWINILTLSSLSNKPLALMQTVLVRAKMCELIAVELDQDKDSYFLSGILSCLDSFLDTPLETLLGNLPLSEDISQALLNRNGPIGAALAFAINYEHWAVTEITFADIELGRISELYLESVQWSDSVLRNLK